MNLDGAIASAVAQYPAVPASWVWAVVGAETSFSDPAPDTWESKVGQYSYGPMQVLLSTARGLGFAIDAEELRDPDTNVLVGTADIADLIERYNLSLDDAGFRSMYSAYNSGRPDAWQTSAQVAANVDRALGYLANYVPSENAMGVGAIAAAVALGWWWSKRKRRA